MIFWMAGVITLSVVLIFLIHQVYEYFKKSFSKPLERNIVNETKSHYEQIYNTLSAARSTMHQPIPVPTEVYSHAPPENMADELMNFMSDLENGDDSGSVTIPPPPPPPEIIQTDIQPYEQELDGISAYQ